MKLVTSAEPITIAEADRIILDQFWKLGNRIYDDGSREEQLDFLLGLETAAFGLKYCPNAMMELRDYFVPAFDSLVTAQAKISPFTGRQVGPAPVSQVATENSSWPTENAPVNGAAPSQFAPVTIPEGFFTVRHSDSDEYETIRIKRAGKNSNLAGKIMAGHINGPNNQSDYQMFCFIDEETGELKIWSRFYDIDPRWPEAVRTVLGMDTEGRIQAGKAYAQVSKRCMVCGLPLTTPDSLDRGIGPVCATAGW